MMIDTCNQIVGIPSQKIEKALQQIDYFISKRSKKVTVHEVQQICGTLNFIGRGIVPGRAFTRRLYAMATVKGKQLLPHHHVRVSAENKMDLEIWKRFPSSPLVFSRPFMNDDIATAQDVNIFSDAFKSWKRGVGAFCDQEWVAKRWPTGFIQKCQPSIEYLELFGVTTAVLLWIKKFPNSKICLFTDNKSARDMINQTSSSCRNCMVLIRLIVLESLIRNVRVFAKYVSSKDNGKADALSRLDFKWFRRLSPE